MENSRIHSLLDSFDKDDNFSLTQSAFKTLPKDNVLPQLTPIKEQKQNLDHYQVEKTFNRKRKFGKSFSFDDSITSPSTLSLRDTSMVSKRQRVGSSNTEMIMNSLEEMSKNESLIGDGTKVYTLPTASAGKHQDLKYISNQTLTDLMAKKYSDTIDDYVIIDCRYPYEYNGGHIKDAVNLHTQDMVDRLIPDCKQNKKTVLVFHCEFSSERAPKLLRYLRNRDRELNAENYPNLYYPEIYLLKGGYKEFFENQKDHCLPQSYVPMLSKDYSSDLRHFRSKSKSWNGFERKCIRF